MTPEKETLATDLAVDGIHAWGRLYDAMSGKLEFEMRYPDGRCDRLPMSQRRSLMENPDRRVRKAAFGSGNAAWHAVEDTAENISRRTIGCDLESREFWLEAIASLEEPLNQLEVLLPRVLPYAAGAG